MSSSKPYFQADPFCSKCAEPRAAATVAASPSVASCAQPALHRSTRSRTSRYGLSRGDGPGGAAANRVGLGVFARHASKIYETARQSQHIPAWPSRTRVHGAHAGSRWTWPRRAPWRSAATSPVGRPGRRDARARMTAFCTGFVRQLSSSAVAWQRKGTAGYASFHPPCYEAGARMPIAAQRPQAALRLAEGRVARRDRKQTPDTAVDAAAKRAKVHERAWCRSLIVAAGACHVGQGVQHLY